jgi:hypothetical protein
LVDLACADRRGLGRRIMGGGGPGVVSQLHGYSTGETNFSDLVIAFLPNLAFFLRKLLHVFFENCVVTVRLHTQELLDDRDGWLFAVPVDHRTMGLADYPFVVTSPMDLGTVSARLVGGRRYRTAADVAADVRLTFDNALRYNTPHDAVWSAARRLLDLFHRRWANSGLPSLDPFSCPLPESSSPPAASEATSVIAGSRLGGAGMLYNRVVMLRGTVGSGRAGEETGPYYVLHYVEGLHWCRLVPMRLDGAFPALTNRGRPHPHAGRPRWRLMPEECGGEVDVTGDRCRVVPSATVNRSADADR